MVSLARWLITKNRQQALAIEIFRYLAAREIHNRRKQIHRRNDRALPLVGGEFRGHADDNGNADAAFTKHVFVAAQRAIVGIGIDGSTIVGKKYNKRIVAQALSLQGIHDFSDAVVHGHEMR